MLELKENRENRAVQVLILETPWHMVLYFIYTFHFVNQNVKRQVLKVQDAIKLIFNASSKTFLRADGLNVF